MKSYNIGDSVWFYVSIACKSPVEGKIIEILNNADMYIIKSDNSQYEVHGQFITGLVISDKETIHNLEVRILNDDKKLQILNKRIVETDTELERAKRTIVELRDEIQRLKYPFNGYNYKKKRKTSPFPFPSPIPDIPDMTPRWTVINGKKFNCMCKNHMEP